MPLKSLLFRAYGVRSGTVRALVLKLARLLDGGELRAELRSDLLRRIFKHYHDVEIGKYSHGGCFVPGQFSRHTKIGAYCSIARTAVGLTRDHPLKFKSTHGLFFNPKVGFVDEEKVDFLSLEIANDVWIGHNTTILPATRTIGNGAVIGAGAVVNRAVPPYAVVVGNPARVVKFRFSADVIARLEAEAWWTRDLDDLQADKHSFTTPLESGYE